MATQEELMRALRNADMAGDTASANRIAKMIQNQKSLDDVEREAFTATAQEAGPLEAALVGVGKGFTDVGRGAANLLGADFQPAPGEREAFEALSGERGFLAGAGEIVGQAAPAVPLALGSQIAAPVVGGALRFGPLAQRLTNIAGQGLVGGLEGAAIAEGTQRDALEGGLVGGGLAAGIEAVSPVFGRAISQVWRRLRGTEPEGALITPQGMPTEELQAALDDTGISFEDFTAEALVNIDPMALDAEQVARKAFLESQGIDPTRAQVSRDASDFMAQQEAAKTSGRLREALEGQQAALSTRFDDAAQQVASQSSSPVASVTDTILRKANTLDSQISNLYRQARESAPDQKNIKFSSLDKRIKSLMPSNTRMGGNIKAVIGEMQNLGILDKNRNLVGKIDVQTAEELRKYMNSLYDPANPFANEGLRQLKDSLDDDVFKAAGKDVFDDARKAKASFERDLSRAKVSKFDSRKSNLVRDILENKINPDTFVNDVINSKKWRSEDISQLKNYLEQDEAGQEAFKDLKSEIIEDIKEKAFVGAEDAAGNRALSRSALERSLNRIGDSKLNAIFTAEEKKFLDDIVKTSKLLEPVRGTQQGRGPSSQAIARLERKISDLPAVGAIVDVIDVDVGGRGALKAKPKRRLREQTEAERLIGSGAGAFAPAALAKEDKE